jgi:Winged helix-turn helix
VARQPEVFVRPLTMEEGRKLQRITRTAKDPIKLRRAIVVMRSGQGQSVRDITSLLQVSDDYGRAVIHAFTEKGFDALDPKWSGGRPRAISDRVREHICLAERGDRRLHPLAQRPCPAQDQLRRRLTHPKLDQLPGQGCVTGH